MSYSNGPQIVTNGLVMYLDAANKKSYPGSGTSWIDLSGNRNNGTSFGSPTFSGENAGSLVFDGTDDRVEISHSVSLAITVSITAMAWIKFSNLSVDRVVVSKPEPFFGTTPSPYELYINNSGKAVFMRGDAFAYGQGSTATNAMSFGVWQHVAATVNTNALIHYLNGSRNGTGTLDNGSGRDQGGKLYIGHRPNNSSPLFTNGNIASVSIYNRALSPDEVLQNYNATKTRFGL